MTAPALLVAVPLALGVLIGSSFGGLPPFTAVTLLLSWLACAVATLSRADLPESRRDTEARVLAAIAATGAVLGCLSAGVLLGAAAERDVTRSSLLAWYEQAPSERAVQIVGVARGDAARTLSAVSLTLDVVEVDGRRVRGGVRLSVAGALAAGAAA